jgi:hypothetical protein
MSIILLFMSEDYVLIAEDADVMNRCGPAPVSLLAVY